MKEDGRPIVGITMGDGAGVGPEIIVKALGQRDLYGRCRPLVIGDAQRLREAGGILASELSVDQVARPNDARFSFGSIDCIDLGLLPIGLAWGQLSPICGNAAYRYLERAVDLAKAKEIDAICTAPLNKEALHAAGHHFPGHTEILAELTNTPEVSLMLLTPKLKVIHVTAHIGLIDAIAKIDAPLVERTIVRAHEICKLLGSDRPQIGVCGINPHAGEHGLFGLGEEEAKIGPAILSCRQRGLNVEGPLPADSLFYKASRGDFDIVVAMYHDQGHGPVKVLGIESGVNITVGLPIVRTSVDHGTAFDIAGTGVADERSLLAAIEAAIWLAGTPTAAENDTARRRDARPRS
jgi:4-phospho-D-threonate 3-dehydrogenase / 4-phospho-D-erythronate 3-dehydrogenase